MTVTTTVRQYLADAGRAFDHAPAEVALALLTAFTFSYGIEVSTVGEEVAHFAVATVLTACIAWSATIMHALGGISSRARWLIVTSGALIAALYLLLTDNLERAAEGWRAFMLLGGVLLLTFSAPALPPLPADANLRLRRINARVFLRAIGIILYGLALFGGLALALAAVNNLFELKLEGKIYGHVFVWIMVVLVPWAIAGGINDYVRPLTEQSDVARVVHRLVTYLVPLLVAIYFVILYAYVIRIAVTGELPRNMVSPMVIAAGSLSLFSLILFDPGPQATAWRWLRYSPIVYLPLVPLGFWALLIRFQDYGWTEFRMLRVLALIAVGVLAVVMGVRVVRRRAFPLRMIPIVLALALLLPAVGPWSALAVSRRDQQHRLRAALNEAKVDPRTPPSPRDTVTHHIPLALYNRITSGSSYLSEHFGVAALRAVVPVFPRTDSRFADLAAYFHLVAIPSDSVQQTLVASFGGASRAVLSDGVAYRIQVPTHDPAHARATLTGDTLFIVVGAERLSVDLQPAMAVAHAAPRGVRMPAKELDALAVTDRLGARRGDLLVLDMMLEQEKGIRHMRHLDAILLLR
jgi:hypothetical protein